MSLQYLAWRQSGAETDIIVHVGPRVVAVERAEAVGGVVPAATRKESA
nr:MAG TPA: hypothetical protein [Caudoviricetes sp.]